MKRYINNEKERDEIVYYTFTSYLSTAVSRRRLLYIEQLKRTQRANYSLDQMLKGMLFDVIVNKEDELPVLLQLESEKLYDALMNLSEKERYVFLTCVLEEKDYMQLANELKTSYKAVAAIYYRTLKKMKDSLKGDANEV